MTSRSIPRADARHRAPPLLVGRTLVALVPVGADLEWCARAAWDVARGCASSRRVALVDLRLADPTLHRPVDLPEAEGIVDALEYERSWDLVAHEVDRVFFIGTGTGAGDPDAVLAHPRWRALHAGFRSEQALLLVFCSASTLDQLGSAPDGVLYLAPVAESADGMDVPARGTDVLGVISGPEPAPRRARPSPAPHVVFPSRARRRNWRPLWAAAGLALVAATGWTVLSRGAARAAPPLPIIATPAARADSVPWTVQLAAYGAPERAVAEADRLTSEGVGTFVAPLALDASGALWYRVLVGAYATREGATAARADLWRRGLAPAGQGQILHAPFSLQLAAGGAGAVDSLRRLGAVPVRWGTSGTELVGAFETPEQASIAAAALSGAGVPATLITRMGTTP